MTAAVNMIQAKASLASTMGAPSRFDLLAAAADLRCAVPARTNPFKQHEDDQRNLQQDALGAFGLMPEAIEEAMTTKCRTPGQEDVMNRFTEAMLVTEAVIKRLECPYSEWRDHITVAKTTSAPGRGRGRGGSVAGAASPVETLNLLDSGAGMTCIMQGNLPRRDEGDKIVCQAVNQSLTRTLGSGTVCFNAPVAGAGAVASISVRRAHELAEIDQNILSLYDHLDAGGQFHAASLGDVYMITGSGQRIQCVFKDRVVQFRAAVAPSE